MSLFQQESGASLSPADKNGDQDEETPSEDSLKEYVEHLVESLEIKAKEEESTCQWARVHEYQNVYLIGAVVVLSCVLVLIYMLLHYLNDGEIHVHLTQYMIVIKNLLTCF